jgi:hypothetical protein
VRKERVWTSSGDPEISKISHNNVLMEQTDQADDTNGFKETGAVKDRFAVSGTPVNFR